MTIETMQWHEKVTLKYGHDDYRRSSVVELVKPYVKGKTILDMRCLTGHLTVDLALKNFDVLGLDAYSGAVEMTNRLAIEKGIQKPVAKLWDLTQPERWVDGKKFDTVLCLDVLNHSKDDQTLLSDILAVMADRGRLILLVPAHPQLLGKRDQLMGHLRRYTKTHIIEMLEKRGLRIEMMRAWNVIALPFYFLIEKLMKKALSDPLRYGRDGKLGSWPNRLLGFWYRWIENRLWFPYGLSYFVIATKVSSAGGSARK